MNSALSFRPPFPLPPARPLGPLALIMALRRNALHIWSRPDFEIPVQIRKTFVDRRALINDPDAIHRVFVANMRNYPKNELQLRLLRPALGAGLITASTDEWRRQRHLLAPMFAPARVAAMADAMNHVAERYVSELEQRLHADPAPVLDVAEEMGVVTFQMLEATLFSDGIACAPGEFQRVIARYFETLGRHDLFDLLGLPDYLPRMNRVRGRQAIRFASDLVDEMIAIRLRLLDAGNAVPDDLLTRLLTARDPSDQGLSRQDVHDNLITFIGAGHDTSANALTWTLYLLSQSPSWRARVEEEIDRMPNDSSGADVPPVTRAVIEEAMRLYPPISLMSRIALNDDVLGGMPIAAGTVVSVAPYVLHRHRTLWEEPDLFDPARFLAPRREAIPRFAYIPFGAGGRVCIGMSFAMTEMSIVLTWLLRHFRFDLVEGHRVVPHVRITTRPQYGMKMRVSRR